MSILELPGLLSPPIAEDEIRDSDIERIIDEMFDGRRVLPAITLWRPWDWAILDGPKRIENRPWKWNTKKYGKHVVLHVAKRYDVESEDAIRMTCPEMPAAKILRRRPSGLGGLATVEFCVNPFVMVGGVRGYHALIAAEQKPWAFGPNGLGLADIVRFPKVLSYNGEQSQPFFVPTAAVVS